MDSKEVEELTIKMKKMDEILNKNLFNNPIREANEKIRKELLEFKTIFKKNLEDLSKQSGNIVSNSSNKATDNEEMEDVKVALEHKTYQVEILKKEFTKYEQKAEEQISDLKIENAKLKYRVSILLKTIEDLEKQNERTNNKNEEITTESSETNSGASGKKKKKKGKKK